MQTPVVGQLIRYSYLWLDEARRDQVEGLKDRPCAVVIATVDDAGLPVLYVAPITHSRPSDDALAVELPAVTKTRLGLDDGRSWVITAETNRFVWPGPDVRPDAAGEAIIGLLPATITNRIIANVRAHALARRFQRVIRQN